MIAPPLREAYLDVVDAATFEPLDPLRVPAVVVGSAWLGPTRIIDNVTVAGQDGRDPLITPPSGQLACRT